MTLEMNCELLFTRFVFGFFLLASFPGSGVSRALSSPKTGVLPDVALEDSCGGTPSLLVSWELLDSFSCSLILYVPRFERVLTDVCLYNCGADFRGLVIQIESFMPAFGGDGVVANGFELTIGASWGCGGGVARCRLSCR